MRRTSDRKRRRSAWRLGWPPAAVPLLAPMFALNMAAHPATTVELRAQTVDSAAFVIRLGTDTTGIERYVRTGDRIEVTGITRSPRTVVRRTTYWLNAAGGVARIRTESPNGQAQEREPEAGAIPLIGGSWVPWELAVMQARQSGRESTTVTVLAGNAPRPTPIRRVANNEYSLPSQFDVMMRIRVDGNGRMLSADAGGGSTVERVRWVDIDRLARDFAARDAAGRGLGALSPRDSTRATVAGAEIVVDYGRPYLRGRPLDLLVPPGQVWRTGANAVTTIRTSRPIGIGSLAVDAGTYGIFTIPGERGWTLILNRQTDTSGLDYDAAQDIGRTDMSVRTLSESVEQFTILVEPQGSGGVLRLRWGRTEASVPIQPGR